MKFATLKLCISFCLMLLFMSGCYTLRPDNIKYNKEKKVYEYEKYNHSFILRDSNHQLVNDTNITRFKHQLKENNYRYPKNKRQEHSDYIKNSDLILTKKYSNISSSILQEEYKDALKEIEALKNIYPDITYYSDILFLEAYSNEQLKREDSARLLYSDFLDYSSGKYSDRFRGYRDYDKNDSLWIFQRNYSRHFLSGKNPVISRDIFKILEPRYYYSSFHPGYTLNREDLSPGSNAYLWFWFGYTFVDHFSFDIMYYRKINYRFDIYTNVYYSEDSWGINIAFPFQIEKTYDNRLGFKMTPFVNFARIDSLTYENNDYHIGQSVLNGGARFSVGYYFIQKLSIGAYYTHNIFNKQNPLRLTKSNVDIWWKNDYDVSLYYNICKTFNIKTGLHNGGFAAGLVYSGLEISYDITNSKFIFGMNFY